MDNPNMNQDNRNFSYNNQPSGSGNNKKDPKGKMKFQTKLALTISGALAIGMIGGFVYQFSNMAGNMVSDYSSNQALEEKIKRDTYVNKDPLKNTNVLTNVSNEDSVTKVVEENMPAVVSITSQITKTVNYFGRTYEQQGVGSGSGIIIEENDKEYYIATNNHVIDGANKIEVTFCDEKTVTAKVKGKDPSGDLAVIVIQKKDMKESTMKAIKVAKIGDSNSTKVGDKVVAIGNALGLGQSATVGVVSALNREVDIEDQKMTLIQTDAAINGGNSGGALLNMNGELIGINSAKLVDTDVEGMGYAIPISNAQAILSELMVSEEVKEGEEGYLGLSGTDISSQESTLYNIPLGALVKEVVKGGAADKAGVQVSDVITKVNGISITTMTSLKQRVASYKAGTEITLTVQRYNNGKYEEQELKLVLMSKKDFDKLEFSEGTEKKDNSKSDDSQEVPDEQSPNEETPDEQDPEQQNPFGGNGYDEDDMYNFFKDFFGNR